jgi:hypothetical protein
LNQEQVLFYYQIELEILEMVTWTFFLPWIWFNKIWMNWILNKSLNSRSSCAFDLRRFRWFGCGKISISLVNLLLSNI